jgi:hypothetical protein
MYSKQIKNKIHKKFRLFHPNGKPNRATKKNEESELVISVTFALCSSRNA